MRKAISNRSGFSIDELLRQERKAIEMLEAAHGRPVKHAPLDVSLDSYGEPIGDSCREPSWQTIYQHRRSGERPCRACKTWRNGLRNFR